MAFVASRLSAQICRRVAPNILRSSAQPSRASRLPFSTATTTPSQPETEPALKLSDSCVRKITEICRDESYLRVLVDGGGCSGFQYKFELDTKVNEDDVRFGPDGRVLVDTISLDYCAGATLDYSVELIKSGFRMVSNPKAEQGCSCGASFALKM